MDNFFDYNNVVANSLTERDEIKQEEADKEGAWREKLKQATEPADILGAEMLKEGLEKGVGYGLKKVGEKYGSEALKTAGERMSNGGLKKVVKGAIDDATSTAKKTGQDVLNKGKKVISEAQGQGEKLVKGAVKEAKSKVENVVNEAQGELSPQEQLENIRGKLSLSKKGRARLRRTQKEQQQEEPPKEATPQEEGEGMKPTTESSLEEQIQAVQDRIRPPIQGKAVETGKLPPKKPVESFEDDFEDIPKEEQTLSQKIKAKLTGEEPQRYIGEPSTEEDLEEKARLERNRITPPKKSQPEPSLERDTEGLQTEEPEAVATKLSKVFEPETPYIPPSQQTGGLDPSTLPEGAGYSRGQVKIPAEREAPEPEPEPEELPEVPSSLPSIEELTKPPEPPTKEIETQTEPEPEAPKPTTQEIETQTEAPKQTTTETQTDTPKQTTTETQTEPKTTTETETQTEPRPPAPKGKKYNEEGELVDDDTALDTATADSTILDDNPIGWLITAGLGIASVLSPLFAHKPKDNPQHALNPSAQFGAE